MQVILSRDALNGALTFAKRATAKRATIPVLSNARLQAERGALLLRTTDLDREIRVTLGDAAADDGFDVTLPAHGLADMVKRSKCGMVALDFDPTAERPDVALDFEGARATLIGAAPADWPENFAEFPGDDAVTFTIMSDVLAEAFARTEFAISTEESRYYLNGVYMHPYQDGLRFVATDGHRLSRYVINQYPEGGAGLPGVIIPRATVADVRKLIGGRKPPVPVRVTVSRHGSKIEFAAGNVAIRSKLIDGTFPDYQRVIPTWNGFHVTMKREELAAIVASVSAVSSERSPTVRFEIEADWAGPGILTASVSDPEAGTASDCCEVQADGGPGIVIGFNARYVLEILATFPGPSVTLEMREAGCPILIHDGAPAGALCVLMPVRV